MAGPVTAEARLRAKNQLTLPDAVVKAGAIEEGETLIIEIEPSSPETLRIHRVRESYAGTYRGLWGPDPEATLEADRDSWGQTE
jgi:hypothetical protein